MVIAANTITKSNVEYICASVEMRFYFVCELILSSRKPELIIKTIQFIALLCNVEQ